MLSLGEAHLTVVLEQGLIYLPEVYGITSTCLCMRGTFERNPNDRIYDALVARGSKFSRPFTSVYETR